MEPPFDAILISPDQAYTRLDPYLRFAHYKPDSPQEIIQPLAWEALEPLSHNGATFGVIPNAIQLMFKVYNPSQQPIDLYLETAFPQLDLVIYECRQNQQVVWQKHLGDGFALTDRAIKTATLLSEVAFPPGMSEIRVYVKTTSSSSIPLYLGNSQAMLVQLTHSTFWKGSFYGLAIAVSFFSLIFFLVSWERIYMLFSGFAVSTAFIMACFDGYGFFLWPQSTNWQHRSVFIFVAVSLLFLTFFSRIYLEPWRKNSISDRLSVAIAWVLFMQLPFLLIIPGTFGAKITGINAFLVYLFFSVVAAKKAVKGEVTAYFYLASFFALLGLGAVTALAALGLLANFHVMLELGLKVSNGFALLMLSLGLGWRVQLLKLREQEVERQLLVAHTESQTKSDFLAQMSHELRTPMNAIVGMSEVLSGTSLDEDQKKYVEIVQTSSDALLSVINSVLDYSRLEAKRVELACEATNLEALMLETLDIFQVHHRHLDFKNHIASNVPKCVSVDPHRLRQVFLNLVGNAVKFTKRGQVSLQCSRVPNDKGDLLLFEVTDTGIGIPKDKQAQLFTPFTQADHTTARKYGGTGLGLSICRQLVELMGGHIGVTSKQGEGSCFWFKIPCVHAEVQNTHEPNTDYVGNEQRLQVLVVEDNQVNIKVIKALLKREGIVPMVAERGYIAVSLVKENKFDLIFMDCEMPEMDGFETTIAIRQYERDVQRAHVPIYALTAHALEEHRQRSIAVGMNGHLGKPVQIAQLRGVIEKVRTAKYAAITSAKNT